MCLQRATIWLQINVQDCPSCLRERCWTFQWKCKKVHLFRIFIVGGQENIAFTENGGIFTATDGVHFPLTIDVVHHMKVPIPASAKWKASDIMSVPSCRCRKQGSLRIPLNLQLQRQSSPPILKKREGEPTYHCRKTKKPTNSTDHYSSTVYFTPLYYFIV